MIPCRLIDNNGDISEGHVATVPACTFLGFTVNKPAPTINTYTATFHFDHLNSQGVAVYLEVL